MALSSLEGYFWGLIDWVFIDLGFYLNLLWICGAFTAAGSALGLLARGFLLGVMVFCGCCIRFEGCLGSCWGVLLRWPID